MQIEIVAVIWLIFFGVLAFSIWQYKPTDFSRDKLDTKKLKRERLLQRFKGFEDVSVQRDTSPDLINKAIRIKSSDKTHVANYTKYRYNGASKRDVEVWHSPTNIWVPCYLMFSTPFEDSCIRYNGQDVTSYDNTSTTQQEAPESTFSRSKYDGSRDSDSFDTVRSRSYYDDSYSSSSSSDSCSDSGSSSSSSSSYD